VSELDLTVGQWRKSSHSGGQGGECVEVAAAAWRKSSHSGGQGGQCVEVATVAPVHAIAVRDSKDPDGPELLLDAAAWRALTARIKG
jgi:hypothetical protein